jgi:rubrerythrin
LPRFLLYSGQDEFITGNFGMPAKKEKKHPGQFDLEFFLYGDDRKNKDYLRNDYWEYCDNCGQKLISRKCEMICPKCGFFRSCSEP